MTEEVAKRQVVTLRIDNISNPSHYLKKKRKPTEIDSHSYQQRAVGNLAKSAQPSFLLLQRTKAVHLQLYAQMTAHRWLLRRVKPLEGKISTQLV